jgi:hypothetical protein
VPPKMKANPRKQELSEALSQATTTSGTIGSVLTPVSSAMTAKAWVGGSSGDFESGLTAQVPNAKKGGTATVDEIQHAYDVCPAEIEDTSGQGPS